MLFVVTTLLLVVSCTSSCPTPYNDTEDSTVQYIPCRPGCQGSITSPRNYPAGQSLTWRFLSEEQGVIVIQFSSLELEPSKDTVTLTESGQSPVTLTSKIDKYGRLVSASDAFYKTQAGAELTVRFDSDLEVEAPGFKLDYAFNDCVQLNQVIEHGRLVSIGDWYIVQCEPGHAVTSSDGDVAYPDPIYCDTTPGSGTQYQWINNHYQCAPILSRCVAPVVLNGHLELVHSASYHVVCDCELCSVVGAVTLTCVEVEPEGVMVWDELQDEHEVPVCVATRCVTPVQTNVTRHDHSSTDRVPGSYYREHCIGQSVPDVTRWCDSTGRWSDGFTEDECY